MLFIKFHLLTVEIIHFHMVIMRHVKRLNAKRNNSLIKKIIKIFIKLKYIFIYLV